jgi:hypothetical protein
MLASLRRERRLRPSPFVERAAQEDSTLVAPRPRDVQPHSLCLGLCSPGRAGFSTAPAMRHARPPGLWTHALPLKQAPAGFAYGLAAKKVAIHPAAPTKNAASLPAHALSAAQLSDEEYARAVPPPQLSWTCGIVVDGSTVCSGAGMGSGAAGVIHDTRQAPGQRLCKPRGLAPCASVSRISAMAHGVGAAQQHARPERVLAGPCCQGRPRPLLVRSPPVPRPPSPAWPPACHPPPSQPPTRRSLRPSHGSCRRRPPPQRQRAHPPHLRPSPPLRRRPRQSLPSPRPPPPSQPPQPRLQSPPPPPRPPRRLSVWRAPPARAAGYAAAAAWRRCRSPRPAPAPARPPPQITRRSRRPARL